MSRPLGIEDDDSKESVEEYKNRLRGGEKSESSEPGLEYYKSYYERYYELLAKYNYLLEWSHTQGNLGHRDLDFYRRAFERAYKGSLK